MSAGQKFKCEIYGKEFKIIDIIGRSKKTAKSIWENDDKKTHDILKEGYRILRYWVSDLKNISHEKIFEDIVHTSMKVEE
jgi:very-short-patch-repair endonuclease